MKKLFLFLTICMGAMSTQLLNAQNTNDNSNDPPSIINPSPYQPPVFELQNASLPQNVTSFLQDKIASYNAYNFDYQALDNYLLNNNYAIEFNLKQGGASTLLTLQRRDIRSPDFIQTQTNAQGTNSIVFERNNVSDASFIVRTLNGVANSNKNKPSRFAIYKNNLKGYIYDVASNKVQYFISLQEFIKESGTTFSTTANPLLVFDINSLRGPNPICGTIADAANSVGDNQYKGYFEKCTPRYLEIAAEGDYWWCQTYGSNSANKILENLFFVEGIYTHHFNISFIVTHINLLPTNSTLYNTTNSEVKLQQLRTHWNTNNTTIKRDVTFLYSGTPIFDGNVVGRAYVNVICNKYQSYLIIANHSGIIKTGAHELGHIFGSDHDQFYESDACDHPSNNPIMCQGTYSSNPYYFSSFTRNIILTSINDHAGCLNDYSNGDPVSKIHKTWSNARDPQWIASWFLNNGDYKLAGNFDGENGDEEIFFASPNRQWVGIMDFSCDQGTNWYHLWGNGGNRSFGTWFRNYDDRYLAGDFDGDGTDEIISISGSNKWFAIQQYHASSGSWTHKYGNGGVGKIAYWTLGTKDRYRVADFDGDGKAELLCVHPNGWAQLIKFNWNTAGYYVPQTIWSNNGNGWVGGVQIGNTDRWLSGKYTQTNRDELFTISGTWVTTQKFNGSSWDWMWSQYGASSFASMYILPLNAEQSILNGNFDNDPQDEFVNINKTWAATADYNGSTFTQNYNNGGTQKLSDWELNKENEYLFIKAAPGANKQILGIRYTPASLASMYKGNSASYNFKPGKNEDEKENDGKKGKEKSVKIKAIGLKVYPNPASGSINVDFSEEYEKAECTITDMAGRIVKSQQITRSTPILSFGSIPEGIYILTVKFDNKNSLTTKFRINK